MSWKKKSTLRLTCNSQSINTHIVYTVWKWKIERKLDGRGVTDDVPCGFWRVRVGNSVAFRPVWPDLTASVGISDSYYSGSSPSGVCWIGCTFFVFIAICRSDVCGLKNKKFLTRSLEICFSLVLTFRSMQPYLDQSTWFDVH